MRDPVNFLGGVYWVGPILGRGGRLGIGTLDLFDFIFVNLCECYSPFGKGGWAGWAKQQGA